LRVPAPSLTRKSDGEWAAEGTRRSRVILYCCGFGISVHAFGDPVRSGYSIQDL